MDYYSKMNDHNLLIYDDVSYVAIMHVSKEYVCR